MKWSAALHGTVTETETECVDGKGMELAQNRVQWWPLACTVLHLRVLLSQY